MARSQDYRWHCGGETVGGGWVMSEGFWDAGHWVFVNLGAGDVCVQFVKMCDTTFMACACVCIQMAPITNFYKFP